MSLGNAITFRMPFGIPGSVTRESVSTIEAQPIGATAFYSYGIPVVITASLALPVTTTAQVVYGFLVRPFPFEENTSTGALLSSTPPTAGVANVLKRGYLAVLVNSGGASAALNTRVYVYTGANSGAHLLGGVEGASGGNIQLIPTAVFTGKVDANNVAEIFFDANVGLTATS